MIFEINFIGGPMDLRRVTLNQEHEPARFYEVMDYPPLLTDKPSDDVSIECRIFRYILLPVRLPRRNSYHPAFYIAVPE